VQALRDRSIRVGEVDVLAGPIQPLAAVATMVVQLDPEALVEQHPPKVIAAVVRYLFRDTIRSGDSISKIQSR
jgi:hypothetical protein